MSRTHLVLTCLALPLLASPALAQTTTGTGASSTMPTNRTGATPTATAPGTSMTNAPAPGTTAGGMAGSASAANLSAGDRRFVEKAAASGLAEVQAGQLAQQKATDPKVKDFAQKMVTDHTTANQKLMALAQAKGLTPPAALDDKHQAELTKLQNADGAKFDKLYMKGQLRDHQEAVRLFQNEADKGQDADLKAFATQTLPILQQHLDMAKSDQVAAK